MKMIDGQAYGAAVAVAPAIELTIVGRLLAIKGVFT